MASLQGINFRTWLAVVGVPVVILLALRGDRDSVEKALGALAICDGLLRLYGLATDERHARPTTSQLRSAALAGVSTVFLGAGFMSFEKAIGMVLLVLSALVPITGWLVHKIVSPGARTSR